MNKLLKEFADEELEPHKELEPGKVPDHKASQIFSCSHLLTGECEATPYRVAQQQDLPEVVKQ